MSFKENKYEVIRNVLSQDLIDYININVEIHENANCFLKNLTDAKQKPYPFGDPQSPNSFSWYSSIHSESLLQFLKPTIEKITGTQLYESYSYARNYYYGATLQRHIDRSSCEYSVTICISKGVDWGIFIEDVDGNANEIELSPGDMVVYRGDLLYHWRNSYQGKTHRQLFLHYVDANGRYKNCKFDGRPMLALPPNIKVRV
jgi:hypothetical protein